MLATALCNLTLGSAPVDRTRDRSGASPVVRRGAAFSWHPVAPQHQQPLQRPSASRPRIR
jgi:hypothetical protein